jgi:mono/diheme cytochrome c family protein
MLRAVLAAALLFAAGQALAAEDPEARGHALVQLHCAGCHSVTPAGRSPNPAAPPFRSLSERYKIDDLGEALAEGILTGHPAMPEFRFPPKDVDAILRYLRAIQTRKEASGAVPTA